MKPIKFKESNITLAKDQPEYQQLPVYRNDINGLKGQTTTSCWKLSFWERWRLMFTGKLWLSIMTFGRSPQPVLPVTQKHIVLGGMTKREYNKTLKRIDQLVKENPEKHTLGWNELQELGDKVIQYEQLYYPIEEPVIEITREIKSVILNTGQNHAGDNTIDFGGMSIKHDPLPLTLEWSKGDILGTVGNFTIDNKQLQADINFSCQETSFEALGYLYCKIGGKVIERDGDKILKFELNEVSLTKNPSPHSKTIREQLLGRMEI